MTIGTILLYILLFLLVLLFIAILFIMCVWMWTGIKSKVPFIPVPNSILPDIEKALNISGGSVVYDLGCGDARVLSYLANKNRDSQFIGIENGLFPVNLARVLTWWNKRKGRGVVEVLDKDFFTHDLKNATHIFLYLYPNVMDDLLSKLEKELAPGSRIVSATFKFTQKKPVLEIDLSRKGYQLAKKLYVYEF